MFKWGIIDMDTFLYRVEAAKQGYYWTVTMSSRLLIGDCLSQDWIVIFDRLHV